MAEKCQPTTVEAQKLCRHENRFTSSDNTTDIENAELLCYYVYMETVQTTYEMCAQHNISSTIDLLFPGDSIKSILFHCLKNCMTVATKSEINFYIQL
jgi:hypothetical protein